MTERTTVDSHQHFWWNPTVTEYPWMTGDLVVIRRSFGPEDLRPHLATCAIDRSILVQTWSSLEETRRFMALAAGTDFVAGVVGWLDLADPASGDTLAELRAGHGGRYLCAVRHQVIDEPDPEWLLHDRVFSGLRAVHDAGLAYDLLVGPRELPAAIEVARRLPELRLVLDHIGKPPISGGQHEVWDVGMAALSQFENVFCKLSGMVTEAPWPDWTVDDLRPYAERVLSWFGPERLMFGSDWPVCLLAASYEQVFETSCALIDELSAGERAAVLGENAHAVYRLDLDGHAEGR